MAYRYKILNLEDNLEDSLRLVDLLMQHDIQPIYKRVETIDQFKEEIGSQTYDIIIADYLLRETTGLDALEYMRARKIDIPFILVSGVIDEEKAVSALRMGAADFIGKTNMARLGPAIIREVRDARIRHERETIASEMQRQEERYTALFKHLHEGILVFNTDQANPHRLVCQDSNTAALSQWNIERNECLGKPIEWFFKDTQHANISKEIIGMRGHDDNKNIDKVLHQSEEYLYYRQYDISWISDNEVVMIVKDITEEVQLQNELRISEEKYRTLLENQSEGICLVDRHENLLYVNSAMESIFEVAKDDLVGTNITDYLDKENEEKLLSITKNHTKGNDKKYTISIQTKEGNKKYLFIASKPYYDGEDKLQGSMALIRDETERIELEERLKQSEEQFRMIMDLLPIGTLLIDTSDRTVRYANPRALAMFGKTYEEVIGKDCHSIYCGEREATPGCERLSQDMPVFTARRTLNCVGDEPTPILRSVLKTTIGEKEQYLEAIVDISEQVKAEQRIKSNLEFLQTLIDTIPNPVFYKDKAGIYRGCNEAFSEQIIGSERKQIIGRSLFDLNEAIPPELAARYKAKDDEVIATEQPQFYEAQVNCADGVIRQYAFSKALYYNPDGEVGGIVGVMLDISQQKETEMQLRHAQKLEAIGQLAAGIAHEINTPVQYIGDNINFMRKSFEDVIPLFNAIQRLQEAAEEEGFSAELHREILKTAEKAQLDFLLEDVPDAIKESLEGVNRVAKIVRAMKEFSHPGAEEKAPFNLNESLSSTITVARNEWKYVADMRTDFDPDLPLVPGLQGDLNQVFLNLIINAAHAITERKGKDSGEKGTIKVSTAMKKNWGVVKVSDTGAGIPEEIRERVFDPFFTTKEVGKGTGQGLAIAYNVIVDKHGGTIEVDSEVGEGTMFTLTLPVDYDDE